MGIVRILYFIFRGQQLTNSCRYSVDLFAECVGALSCMNFMVVLKVFLTKVHGLWCFLRMDIKAFKFILTPSSTIQGSTIIPSNNTYMKHDDPVSLAAQAFMIISFICSLDPRFLDPTIKSNDCSVSFVRKQNMAPSSHLSDDFVIFFFCFKVFFQLMSQVYRPFSEDLFWWFIDTVHWLMRF